MKELIENIFDTVKYNHLPSPVWDRYYYDTLNRLWKVEYAQTSGFSQRIDDGQWTMDDLVLFARAWMDNETTDFADYTDKISENPRQSVVKDTDEKIYTLSVGNWTSSLRNSQSIRNLWNRPSIWRRILPAAFIPANPPAIHMFSLVSPHLFHIINPTLFDRSISTLLKLKK